MSKKVSCKDVRKYVCQCLAQDTGSERCKALKKHLDECDDCLNYFKSVEITIDCYRKYNVDLPEDTHKRLISFLNLEED
jgi:hypothetical protein